MEELSPQALEASERALNARLLLALGSRTYREVGEATGTHPETVRRYAQGKVPSVEFLAALCELQHISPDWLLNGHGSMTRGQSIGHALAHASSAALLEALGASMEGVESRMSRVEVLMHALADRLEDDGAGQDGRASLRLLSEQVEQTGDAHP